MGEVPKINDLPQVIEPHLNGGRLVSYSSRYLTKPGDNYGSLMIAVTANVNRPDGQIEELPVVAKLPPITNDFYWQIFKPERTCLTENAVYKYLGPAIRKLQLEAGVEESQLFDGFPRYYGSRISLDVSATVVDRDAVLLQENLQTSGFKAGNRHKMFDFAHAELVLVQLAQFHALPIALRLKKPKEYEQNVRPYFRRFNMQDNMAPDVKDQFNEETLLEIELATNNNEKAVERYKELMDQYVKFLESPDTADGLFSSIGHFDLWINNLMVQYDENGAPSKLKIVDFQIAQYASLVHDVFFFLFSSVDTTILEQHFDEFLRIYYKAFIQCLEQVDVSTAEYSFEIFMEEVRRVAPIEIPHAIFMTKVILADNSTMPEEFKDMDINVISKNRGVAEISQKTGDIIRLVQKFKFFY